MDGQRIGSRCQLVAEHAIERRQHGFTSPRRRFLAHQRHHASQHGIDRAACQPRHAFDAAIHQPGNSQRAHTAATGRSINEFSAQRAKERRHRLVHIALHVFSQPGHAQRRLRGQLRQPLNIRKMQIGGQLRKAGFGLLGRLGGVHAPIVRSLQGLRQPFVTAENYYHLNSCLRPPSLRISLFSLKIYRFKASSGARLR